MLNGMRLSEAILIGCCGTNKIKMCYFDQNEIGIGCCVLGAAAIGAGCRHNKDEIRSFLDTNLEIPTQLWSEIQKRNDHTDQSRESIAEWLDQSGY